MSAPVVPASHPCPRLPAGGVNPYARGGARAAVLDRVIHENSHAAREPAHKLFQKIAGNILSAPLEPKFRRMNLEKVMAKFGAEFKGIAELLHSVGFVPEGCNIVMPESTTLDALCQALCAWDEREAQFAAARAEAERIRQENLALIAADRAKKEAARAHIKSLAAQAREDVAAKPVTASQGHELRFGSTVCKAPPPPPQQQKGG